jgi:hypothetical protein
MIALSAGTGIATFALEYLPERIQVDNVIFLGSSLSSQYDLTRAMKRVRGGLYCIHSPSDFILRDIVRYTGTVDRRDAIDGVAGLQGFILPTHGIDVAKRQYAKLHNVEYRDEFANVGYFGQHMDCTNRAFVREYLSGVLMGTDSRLIGHAAQRSHIADAKAKRPGREKRPIRRSALTDDDGGPMQQQADRPVPERETSRSYPSKSTRALRRVNDEPTSRPSYFGMP